MPWDPANSVQTFLFCHPSHLRDAHKGRILIQAFSPSIRFIFFFNCTICYLPLQSFFWGSFLWVFLCFSLHKMPGFLRNEPGENQISAIAFASTFAYSFCLFATKILCAQFSLSLIHRWLPRLWLFANDCGIGYFCFQLMHCILRLMAF